MLLDIIVCGIVVLALIYIGIPILSESFLFTFLYVEYSLGSLYHPNEYKPVRFGLYFKNYCKEIWYVIAKFFLLPLKWVNLSINGNQKSDTAVLLIHGYYRNQIDWLWLRKQLKASNYPIFTINLKPPLAGIQEIALSSLPQQIAKMQKQTTCKNIILIGHSMGGLVASYYSEFLDHENIIKAVISLGSPFYGTKISIGAAGENARQMLPGSRFLAELREKIKRQPQKYYQVCSKFDNLIFPWKSALLENHVDAMQMVLPFESHLGLLHSRKVAVQIKKWLAR